MPAGVNASGALLPAEDTQKDLSVLRAAKVDLSGLCPPPPGDTQTEASVLHESYEYVASLRRTLKIAKEGDIDQIGARIESLRDVLDTITTDLERGTRQNK